MTFEQIIKLQEMGFTSEDIMELIKAGDPAAPLKDEPEKKVEPEKKEESVKKEEPVKKVESDDSKFDSLLSKIDTLTSAIQNSNRLNAELTDVRTNQQIVDDMLASIVNPSYTPEK